MKILAIESSTTRRSVALAEDTAIVWDTSLELEVSDRTLVSIERALRETGWAPKQIELIGVSVGPGSFTGVRLAIATAIGWNAAWNTPCVGVSGFDAMAGDLQSRGFRGRHAMLADAQRGEFALGLYELSNDGCVPCEPLRVAARSELVSLTNEGVTLHGPDLMALSPMVRPLFPTATWIAKFAGRKSERVEPGALEPLHVRQAVFQKAPPPRFRAELL